jgi:hypothetical protein
VLFFGALVAAKALDVILKLIKQMNGVHL